MNVLFVCTGNTCRSPLAEVLLLRILSENNIENVGVQSCGLSAYPGCPASENSAMIAPEFGFSLNFHEAKQYDDKLADWADMIITMSDSHKAVIDKFFEKYSSKVQVLGKGIFDPYGGDLAEYRQCAKEIEFELKKLVDGGVFCGKR